MRCLLFLALAIGATSASAQQLGVPRSTYADGILVTTGDAACPYTALGAVSANMRVLGWQSDPSDAQIFAKLRKNAAKEGADGVVLVTIGHPHMTLMSPRSIPVTGRMIRYLNRSCAPTQ